MSTLNEAGFWQLIAEARQRANEDPYEICNQLSALLLARDAADIIEFQRIFDRLFFASYRADLWGAAYLMNGGASDDGFDYFRGWLIAQGQKVFEAAMVNPDSLAEIISDNAEADFGFEDGDMLGVALRAWETKTGNNDYDYHTIFGSAGKLPPLGEFEWSNDAGDIDEIKGQRLYPRLWRKFH
jgi:hypothetical protein